MAGFDNDVIYGINADYSNALNGTGASIVGQLLTDSQMWIGVTAANAGGTHINVGTLTSPDSSITFGYSSPNITATVTGGSTSVLRLTGNSGVATPSGGNINVITANSTVKFIGSGSTLTQDFGLTNLIIGNSSSSITSATLNVGLGTLALAALTSGLQNVAIGNQAGGALTTGLGNVLIGANAGKQITTSSGNVAVGLSALNLFVSGAANAGQNCAFGSNSLNSLTTGINNAAFGDNTITGINTGSYNISFGYHAGISHTLADSSNIDIGNSGTVGQSNTIRLGTQGSGNGQQNVCFVAGITGVTVSNQQLVTINSSTGQLGVTTSSEVLWNVVSTNQTGATSNGYIFVSPGGALTISLPTTSSVGDEFSVVLDGATSWQITQAAGQQIRLASSTTTLGATGSLTSTAQGNAVTLVCRVANTTWTATSSIGNITVA